MLHLDQISHEAEAVNHNLAEEKIIYIIKNQYKLFATLKQQVKIYFI